MLYPYALPAFIFKKTSPLAKPVKEGYFVYYTLLNHCSIGQYRGNGKKTDGSFT